MSANYAVYVGIPALSPNHPISVWLSARRVDEVLVEFDEGNPGGWIPQSRGCRWFVR